MATFESTYPIMNKIMWGRNDEAMLATRSASGASCSVNWMAAFRIGSLAAVFLVAPWLFGILRSPLALMVVPFAMLVGVAFASA